MDYQQLYKLCDWLAASVVMVFIPTDGHGYCGNGSRLSIGSITGKNMLRNTSASSLLSNLVGHREISVNTAAREVEVFKS